jgi:hypothetical protein
MKKGILFIGTIILVVMFYSCASIVSKSNWPLVVNSNPSGAAIIVSNRGGVDVFKGTTPATMTLRSSAGFFKKESYKIKFQLSGFDTKMIPVECTINGWYFGNILIGGLIGMLIIDPATGAMYKLDAATITEAMSKTSVTAQAAPKLNVYSINDLPESYKEHLVKIN